MQSLPHFIELCLILWNILSQACFSRARPSQAFLVETVETGDKYRDNFHFIQISLVMSMRFIFANDWNDACKLITFSLFGNDAIFPESRPLITM